MTSNGAASVGGVVRVLHCLPWLTSGGVERRRLELARRLSKRYAQRVVCLRAKPELRAQFEQAGVMVDEVGEPFGLRALSAVARAARVFRPSLVHGAVFEGVSMANLAAVASFAPHLVVEEIDYPIHRSWRGHALFRLLSMRADRCVAVSPAVVQYLQATARIPEHKTRLIVNGISAPQLPSSAERERLRASLDIPAGAFVIGSVGRLDDGHKRFSDLLRALPEVLRRVPTALLLIVGDGRDRKILEQLAGALGVMGKVRFAGYQHDVGPMFSLMSLFALASERESFGLVLVEAMFSGLPVVATEVGGIPSIVASGETGLLVPVGSPAALADAISAIATDDARRAAMGQAGAERAQARFGAERYVSDVERLYAELSP